MNSLAAGGGACWRRWKRPRHLARWRVAELSQPASRNGAQRWRVGRTSRSPAPNGDAGWQQRQAAEQAPSVPAGSVAGRERSTGVAWRAGGSSGARGQRGGRRQQRRAAARASSSRWRWPHAALQRGMAASRAGQQRRAAARPSRRPSLAAAAGGLSGGGGSTSGFRRPLYRWRSRRYQVMEGNGGKEA